MAKKNQLKRGKQKRRSMSEMINGFAAFLTTRKKPLVFGSAHDCAPIGEIVTKFCNANRLAPPRDKYPKVKTPAGTEHLTNVPAPPHAMTCKVFNFQESLDKLWNIIGSTERDSRDAVLAAFLDRIKKQRAMHVADAQKFKNSVEKSLYEAEDSLLDLDKVIRGDFKIIIPPTDGTDKINKS